MNFIDFPESNFTFTKPADMTDEQCGSLKVWRGQHPEGYPAIISKWQPSVEERLEIANGGDIYLMIVGSGMPPVSIFTQNPFSSNDADQLQPGSEPGQTGQERGA